MTPMCGLNLEQRRLDQPTPIDPRAIAALSLCNAAHFYSICSLFSYAAFLCRDAGWVEHIDEAGFTAGLLATAVMAGRILTSYPWGLLSDRISRGACLQLSMLAVGIGNLLFGFATRRWAALLVRFVVIGMGNGWVSLIGPISQAVGGTERQSEVLGMVFASGSVVQMLGPALGGLLYGAWFPTFPAAAPSLVGCTIALLAIAVNHAWLPPLDTPRRGSVAIQAVSEDPHGDPAGLELDPAAGMHPTSAHEIEETGTEKATKMEAKEVIATGAQTARETGTGPVGNGAACGARAVDDMAPPPPTLLHVLCSHPLALVCLLRVGVGCLLFGLFDVVPLWLAASEGRGGEGLAI